MPDDGGGTANASVVARVFSLFGAFDDRHRALTLSQISSRSGLPMTTTHRLVGQLARLQALVRRADGTYVVGRRMWDLGLLAPVHTELRQIASPYLHDLYGATLATVHLAERDGTRVLYLDRLSGHASVPVVSDVGDRLPMHATGVGKVLLAHAPAAVQAAVLGNLTRITPYTITRPGQLRAQLDRVLRDGYAYTNEEMSLGACSVAVPVVGADHAVIAALGIVVPSLKRGRRRLVAALQVAAQGISRSLADAASRA